MTGDTGIFKIEYVRVAPIEGQCWISHAIYIKHVDTATLGNRDCECSADPNSISQ